ncbi:MAG: hypothetical protein LBD17_04490 [Endomicrobium sp.]|jgi:hypothetical protein|nr:hypothetical protein [Endomicrobium sp.]
MRKYICQERNETKKSVRIKIIQKEGSRLVGMEHIGVAHNADKVRIFLGLEKEQVKDEGQEELIFNGFEEKRMSAITIKKAYSKYLYDRLEFIYEERLKLKELKDEAFKVICNEFGLRSSNYNKQVSYLFNVEKNFRMAKSDLKAYPIFQ